jgi:tRNA(fMet)-specific endonuclease VapC
MAVYLLDTNAISDLMNHHPTLVANVTRRRKHMRVSAIVRGEIQYGIQRLPHGKKRANLERLANVVFASMPCETVSEGIADRYGALRRDVESRGLACDDNDLWIAATALNIGAIVVTRDQDMRRMPGLAIEDWTK